MRTTTAAVALAFAFSGAPAFAEDAKPAPPAATEFEPLQQVQLSDDQVARYVASIGDMQAAMGDMPADASQPDAKTMAKLEALAKKHGFHNFEDYNVVAGNIELVVGGVDPETKKYVGPEKLIQKALIDLKTDTKMSAADKKTAEADLQAQLKAVMPLKFPGNVDVVLKHYDQLNGD